MIPSPSDPSTPPAADDNPNSALAAAMAAAQAVSDRNNSEPADPLISENDAVAVAAEVEVEDLPEPKIDSHGRAYATGKRKTSVARVWIKPGAGRVLVNGREHDHYFRRHVLNIMMLEPLIRVDRSGQFDIVSRVHGGGLSGQASAFRHGLARALVNYEPELRRILRQEGMLTRDSRIVERKKYGRRKARRRFQFSKR